MQNNIFFKSKNRISVLFFCLLFNFFSFAQVNEDYSVIDKKMDEIPKSSTTSTASITQYIAQNFETENEKIRAVFYWIASNISYDVANMKNPHLGESSQDRITKALKTKKGVCEDYVLIFNDISNALGFKTFFVGGYTKDTNGRTSSLSHSWSVAKIEGKWFLFDPTWGSGYVKENKYFPKIKNDYFKAAPEKLNSSHMPFDYLWQFVNYPITNQEFIDGNTQMDESHEYYDFEKEIIRYESLSPVDQTIACISRVEKNGLKNDLIIDFYQYKKKELDYLNKNKGTDELNAIVKEMNEAVALMNTFISYRNKQFKPTIPDNELVMMIQKPIDIMIKCQKDLNSFDLKGNENAFKINDFKKGIESNLSKAKEQLEFVNKYLNR